MLSPAEKTVAAAAGGIVAAVGSALCCAGPLVAISLGLSGAGLAATFDPLRPWFVGATLLSLGAGFWLLRREEARACSPGAPCVSPVTRRRLTVLLWVAAGVAIPLLSFPWWSPFIFGLTCPLGMASASSAATQGSPAVAQISDTAVVRLKITSMT